jgi:lysine-N-methylase
VWEKYQTIDQGPLRVLMETRVELHPLKEDGAEPARFATVQLDEAGVCAFLNEDRLCRIQAAHGEGYLSTACATYPREVRSINGLEEKSLSLSCPEAARLVLLRDAMEMNRGHVEAVLEWESWRPLKDYLWPTRELVLRLIRDRRFELWERVLLVGVFVERLEGLVIEGAVEMGRFRKLMEGFGVGLDARLDPGPEHSGMQAALRAIAVDAGRQLDFVLRAAGLPLTRSRVGPRFVATVERFKAGLGYGPGATMESLVSAYRRGFAGSFEPFFCARGHILENLLANMVFRSLFPFGRKMGEPEWVPSLKREFALLVGQFALLKGLLIGVAGSAGEEFCEADVVETIQSTAKHFEHHQGYLDGLYNLLVERGLNEMAGLAVLMRN